MPTLALLGGSHIHTPNFAKKMAEAADINVKYIWDPDDHFAQKNQQVTGGEVIAEPRRALDDGEVDGVVICSTTDLHAQLVPAAAEAGKAMFVEKPLGMTGDEATRMADAVERAGVIFQTGYFMRGDPPVRWIRDAVRDGKLGTVTRARASNCHNGAFRGFFDGDYRWMTDPARSGCGGFGDLGTHVLDLLLWIIEDAGKEPVHRVTATLGNTTGKYGDAVDEYGLGLLAFRSGAAADLNAGWVDQADPMRLEVSGTRGHAAIIHGKLRVKAEGIEVDDDQQPLDLPEEKWPHAFDLFLDALRGKDVPLVTAREAARRNVVMDAMYDAAHRRAWVEVAA